MAPFQVAFLLFSIMLSACEGAKQWSRPADGKARLVKGNDGVQTIVFESPTDGVWEIGNGQIWHKPVGGGPVNKTAEFDPVPTDYIERKMKELTGGSIRVQGDPAGSIRPAGNKSGGGGGSIRTQPTGSIRGGTGKKLWNRPNDGKARLVKGNDGVQTIVFESPTDGVWEIGNGQIWHKPVGGGPLNKTAEFDPIPTDYIEKKMKELTGGSIRVQGDAAGSIRPNNKSGGGGTGSIRPPPDAGKGPSGSIRTTEPSSGSIRTNPSGSIRTNAGDSAAPGSSSSKWKFPWKSSSSSAGAAADAPPSNTTGPQVVHLPKLWTIEELGDKALIDKEHLRKDDERNYKGDIVLLGQFHDGVFVSERRIDGERMGDATTRLVKKAYNEKD